MRVALKNSVYFFAATPYNITQGHACDTPGPTHGVHTRHKPNISHVTIILSLKYITPDLVFDTNVNSDVNR